jgi:N-acetylmuramoyl-L-alanine amidase
MSKHIIIDIGHANGTGARGNGYEEHALCAIVGKKLKKRLEKHGVKVTLLDFPTLSNKQDLTRTIRTANAAKAVTFGVSLHMDAASSDTAHGGHVCFASVKGREIAERMASRLVEVMPGRAVTVQKRTGLAVLTQTRAPWALYELGFITHAGDIKKLVDDPATEKNELKPLLNALEQGILDALERAEAWNTKTE